MDEKIQETVTDKNVNEGEEVVLTLDINEYVNMNLENLDKSITNIFLSDDFKEKVLPKFFSDNFNKMSYKDRKELFFGVHRAVMDYYGTIPNRILITKDTPRVDNLINIDSEKVVFNDLVFKRKNLGITLLGRYISELRKYLVSETILVSYDYKDFDRDKLSKLGKEYHDNFAQSPLSAWDNYLTIDDKNYINQPIIADGNLLTIKITKEYIKHLFKKFNKIDTEISAIAYEQMNFKSELQKTIFNRNKVAEKNVKNVLNMVNEAQNILDYITVCDSNLKDLSDDDFYALFNSSYAIPLIENFGDDVGIRLENLVNELIQRTFKDFPEFKSDTFRYEIKDMDNYLKATIHMEDGSASFDFDNVETLFATVVTQIGVVAQLNNFFKFNSKREERDYIDTVEWCKQNHENKDLYKKITENEANIIIIKTEELIIGIHDKMKKAIAKSPYLPHGDPLITYSDRQARDDFIEFKTGISKKDNYEAIMNYIRKNLKRKGK